MTMQKWTGKFRKIAKETEKPKVLEINKNEPAPVASFAETIGAKPILKKEVFDTREIKDLVSGVFYANKVTEAGCVGCSSVLAYIVIASTLLGFSMPFIRAGESENAIGKLILVFMGFALFGIINMWQAKYIITFYTTKKGNLFLEFGSSSKEKRIVQIASYNFFYTTAAMKNSFTKSLVVTAKDINGQIHSFSGKIASSVLSLAEPTLFYDNYKAKYTAEKDSPQIEQIIRFLEATDIHREKCLR